MKTIHLLAITTVMVVVSATEEPGSQKVQLCGRRLAMALKFYCEEKNIDYALQHSQYNEDSENHFHHGHHRSYDPAHHRGRDPGHDLCHQAEANSPDTTLDHSLFDECCLKACELKDFIRHCPHYDLLK